MALIPIKSADGKTVIGYHDDSESLEPDWKPWKGGEYDDSDGQFVPGKSHVLKRVLPNGEVRIGRAEGKGWHSFQFYRRLVPADMKYPVT